MFYCEVWFIRFAFFIYILHSDPTYFGITVVYLISFFKVLTLHWCTVSSTAATSMNHTLLHRPTALTINLTSVVFYT